IIRIWLATDCCGNTNICTQTVIVVDNTPPVINCGASKTVECGSTWSFDVPSAFDRCCGTNVSITLLNTITNVNADGTPSGPCSQVITATWEATDCCGNRTNCSQTITVTDTTPPAITCAPGIGVICGTPWHFDPPTAYDDCCGSNVTITVLGTVTNGHGCDL